MRKVKEILKDYEYKKSTREELGVFKYGYALSNISDYLKKRGDNTYKIPKSLKVKIDIIYN